MALTFYFSGNRRIQPWSFPGGVCAFIPSLRADASTKNSAASRPALRVPTHAHKKASVPMQLLAR